MRDDLFKLTVREVTDDGGVIESAYWVTPAQADAFGRGEGIPTSVNMVAVDVADDGVLVRVYGDDA